MKIAMVVYAQYSRDARFRRYAESLAGKGHQVDIICLKEDYSPQYKKLKLYKFPFPRRRKNFSWYFLEYGLFFCYTFGLLSILSLFKKYKIVHIHNMPDFLVFTAVMPKFRGSRIILDMHDPMPELLMTKYRLNHSHWLMNLVYFLERQAFIFADKIITANSEFKKIFLERQTISADKIEVILNYPDPKLFKPVSRKTASENFILMYMGTVDERFGLDIALEAIPAIKNKIPQIKLIIIPKISGEGNYYSQLVQRITKLKIGRYVEIRKPVALDEIAKEIHLADIGLTLVKKNLFTEKILPLKLTEFMAGGIPVIATRTKLLSRYFSGKMICYLTENTSAEFSRKVLFLYRNKKQRELYGKNALLFFRKYNWHMEEKKYYRIIRTLTQ